ncbi:MAG: hypothetical protein P8X68_09245 [Desulfobacterales bacterium]|jgi:hypothetical protein
MKLTNEKDYILVEPSAGVDFWEIIEGIGKLFTFDGFPQKNDLWKFREGPLSFQYGDIYRVKDFISKYYPKNQNGHKTAIVVENGFQSGIAKEFANIVKDLPFETGVFFDTESAEEWIKNK